MACAGTFGRPCVSVRAAVVGFAGVLGCGVAGVTAAATGAEGGVAMTTGGGPGLAGTGSADGTWATGGMVCAGTSGRPCVSVIAVVAEFDGVFGGGVAGRVAAAAGTEG